MNYAAKRVNWCDFRVRMEFWYSGNLDRIRSPNSVSRLSRLSHCSGYLVTVQIRSLITLLSPVVVATSSSSAQAIDSVIWAEPSLVSYGSHFNRNADEAYLHPAQTSSRRITRVK